MNNDCFRLKGSVLTTFILEFTDYDADDFKQQLAAKVESAPEFFKQSPVIISLEKIDLQQHSVNLAELVDICKSYGLLPVAFKQAPQLNIKAIAETGLSILDEKACGKSQPVEAAVTQKPANVKASKLLEKTVRSGQQVYAEGSDLIIIGSVSGGAEVLADGNIHIYGSLRGRALAGVSGDTSARIFCHNNEAELVSIAGHFLLSDALEGQTWKQAAQFFLSGQTLHVGPLS